MVCGYGSVLSVSVRILLCCDRHVWCVGMGQFCRCEYVFVGMSHFVLMCLCCCHSCMVRAWKGLPLSVLTSVSGCVVTHV